MRTAYVLGATDLKFYNDKRNTPLNHIKNINIRKVKGLNVLCALNTFSKTVKEFEQLRCTFKSKYNIKVYQVHVH